MQVVTGAVIGSMANYAMTPLLDKTVPPLYYKGKQLLGLNVDGDASVKINPDELTELSTDPYVGYFSGPLPKDTKEIDKKTMEEEVENKKQSNKILDDIATLSVGIFIFYTVYKITKESSKIDFSEMFIDF